MPDGRDCPERGGREGGFFGDGGSMPSRICGDGRANGRPVPVDFEKKGIYLLYSKVGVRLVEEVFQRVQALADHPDMGLVVTEFDQPFLRELIPPPCRVVYRHDPQRVRIVRVWRSERLLHLPAVDDKAPSET